MPICPIFCFIYLLQNGWTQWAIGFQWICLSVCFLTPLKYLTLISWNFEGLFPEAKILPDSAYRSSEKKVFAVEAPLQIPLTTTTILFCSGATTISLSKHLSVSESVWLFDCLFVCLFPNSSETTNPSELKYWEMILLGMEKVLG